MNMESTNVQRVQQLFSDFGRADVSAILNALADDVEWVVTGPREISYAGTRRGKAQVAEFFATLASTLDVQRFEPKEFIAQGDQVAVIGSERMKVKATDRAVDNVWVMVFTLRDGAIVRFRSFEDTAAVAAAFRP